MSERRYFLYRENASAIGQLMYWVIEGDTTLCYTWPGKFPWLITDLTGHPGSRQSILSATESGLLVESSKRPYQALLADALKKLSDPW